MTLLRSLALMLALLAPLTARAQQAVWDPEEIARAAEIAAQVSEQVSRAIQVANQFNDLGRALGRKGKLTSLDFSNTNTIQRIAAIAPALSEAVKGISDIGSTSIASYTDAQSFVARLSRFTAAGRDGSIALDNRRAAVATLGSQAVKIGYAQAMLARDELATAAASNSVIAAQAANSNDLRGDVAANTAAALALYQRMAVIQGLLASIAEIESSKRLANDIRKQE